MKGLGLKPESKTLSKAFAALAVAAIAAGCAYYPPGSRDYRGYYAGAEQSVRFGVVESVREVRLQAGETGVGAAGGAVLGGIAGSSVGRGSGSVAGAVGGAILGGIVGQEIERSGNEHPGIEVTVLLDSGRYIAVVQGADETFRAGDRVRVLGGRGSTRVTH